VDRSKKTTSAGRKVLAALLMILLFSVLVPTRGAEVAQSKDQSQTCQYNADALAAVEGPFTLEINRAAVAVVHAEKDICLQSPIILIHPYRGPPVLS
jgi:hypothetical protein